MIKVTPAQLQTIKKILARRAPGERALAFGSRVSGTPKEYSDLDIAIIAKEKLDIATLSALREDFAESDLPFRVDALDWHSISPEFKKIIEAKHAEIFL
ncbi:MAG: nucleotidyltransferase domain-containing protein [Elusimicrobiales bacterium]